MSSTTEKHAFIRKYPFSEDASLPGRVLHQVKVGDVYVSRLVIEPDTVTGNFYHKKTNRILFVETGKVKMKFVHVKSGEETEVMLTPGSGIIHMPPHTAIASKNAGKTDAVIIIFSDKKVRAGDQYRYLIYPDN